MEISRQELMFQSNRRFVPGIRHADVKGHKEDKPIRLQPDRIAGEEFHLGIKGRLPSIKGKLAPLWVSLYSRLYPILHDSFRCCACPNNNILLVCEFCAIHLNEYHVADIFRVGNRFID